VFGQSTTHPAINLPRREIAKQTKEQKQKNHFHLRIPCTRQGERICKTKGVEGTKNQEINKSINQNYHIISHKREQKTKTPAQHAQN